MTRSDQPEQLRARNDAMRDQVNGMLADLQRRTATLKEAQQRAAGVSGTATSRDGAVTVSVNAAGVVTDVRLAPNTFDRTTPEKLARTITELARGAAGDARAQTESIFAPLQEGVPDLPDILPGAPSLQDLRPPPVQETSRSRRGPDDDEDFADESFLK